ncbi:ribosome biogenesis protein [Candidatus Woesearchaeota archaeon]|nr:ribosome biogenesis protein [Candidatus Woesearchaeota archaeon]
MLHILKCDKCLTYTLKLFCPACGEKTLSPKPAKFSIEDKWGYWRRKAKKEQGLL